jgi:hypothetical protein
MTQTALIVAIVDDLYKQAADHKLGFPTEAMRSPALRSLVAFWLPPEDRLRLKQVAHVCGLSQSGLVQHVLGVRRRALVEAVDARDAAKGRVVKTRRKKEVGGKKRASRRSGETTIEEQDEEIRAREVLAGVRPLTSRPGVAPKLSREEQRKADFAALGPAPTREEAVVVRQQRVQRGLKRLRTGR